ncbi:MAG: hypothetical protein FWB91_13415 [Defluviitaleaceae bacterium]|nr:hypothetical protein [Defluviitaleaceae bacterium]MCL2218000.1 hypothetical protein [Defluviitaleaceae bacterium]
MCVATSSRYLEILEFKHFVKHNVFNGAGEKSRNKVLKKYITVKVVIDIHAHIYRKAHIIYNGFYRRFR